MTDCVFFGEMNRTLDCLFPEGNGTVCIPLFQKPDNTTTENGDTVSSLIITVVSLLLNVVALVDLTIQGKLRSPFDFYIVVLLISNIIYLTTYGTLSFLTQSFRSWWIGSEACTVFLYNRYFTYPIVLHIHMIIGLNRGWAMTFPISYRNLHSFKFAWLACLGMVLYIHGCQLPGFVLDALYYRLPPDKGCWVNANKQFTWVMFTTFWMYAPKLLIPLAYPFLVRKWIRTRFRRVGRHVSVVPAESAHGDSDSRYGAATTTTQAVEIDLKRSRPFILLTTMTLMALVCWMPSFMYYCLISFNYPVNRLETLGKVALATSPFQALIDPIIFCFDTSAFCMYCNRTLKVIRHWRNGIATG